jgi:hypothetical protein
MSKFNKSLVIAVLVAVMALATIGGVALAQDDKAPTPASSQEIFFDKLAQRLGVNVDEIKAAFTQAREDYLNEQVAQGRITSEQKSLYLERMQQMQEQGCALGNGYRGCGASANGGCFGCHGNLAPPAVQPRTQ